ncbi:MAG: HAD family phosphatase [Bacteroidales bacterium]|nr:HAD family phosphatase [Bacteroidales bacterium]
MIKNLVFDFGKVLVDYEFDSVLRTFFDDEAELARFKKHFVSSNFIDKCDKEDIPFQQIIDEEKAVHPEWSVQLQMFYDRYLDFVTEEVPGMRDILIKYRQKGYKLYGLTNWNSVVYKVIEKFDILQFLDDRLISSEEHLLKPDVAIYKRLCDKFGLVPGECVFADDKLPNVEGARAYGLNAIHFMNAEQYEKELITILSGE